MAEYYPLLAKAVSTLRDGPADKRQAIYARAKAALVGQLRSMEQANPELIDRETRALDEAIARVEAEIGAPARPAEPAPFGAVPSEVARSGPAAVARRQPPPPTMPPRPAPSSAPPSSTPPERANGAPVSSAPSVPPRAPAARPVAAPKLPPAPTVKAEAAGATPLPAAPRLELKPLGPPATERTGSAAAPPREEAARPVAPRQPLVRERFTARGLVVALVAAVAVATIAYAAWRLRDKPEALARARAALQASQQSDAPGKVGTRAEGGTPDGAPAPSAGGDGQPAPATAGDAAPNAAPAASVPVSQRAAFLVDAPDDPQKMKTFVGHVVWTTENASAGQGQPLTTTVKADIDVPDAFLKLSMTIQKNVEPQFPASHTIQIRFTTTPGNTLGAVKQINVPQLRKDDAPTGDPLAGLPVMITENYFLVGLSRGDVVARNLDLLQSRNWIDVPCLLASGKVAKITFEKGAVGDKLLGEAIQSWQ